MKRTQIQVPDPLYEQARRVAGDRDWSVSEVFRRAVEQYVAECATPSGSTPWALPEPRKMGRERIPAGRWRDLLEADESTIDGALR